MNASLKFTTDETTGALKVSIEGVFDGAAALQLQQLLEQLKANTVELDFSQTRRFVDLAVALVTRAVANRTVKLRGVSEHQARMFRYFGIGTAPGEHATDYYKPEDVLGA